MPAILVIEDDAALRSQLEQMLDQPDWHVATAESGEAALALLRQRRFDLVLTDLRLGAEVDGLELLEHVKLHAPETEVIIMTAYGSVETGVFAIQHGAYDYVIKPFREFELLAVMRRALERGRVVGDASGEHTLRTAGDGTATPRRGTGVEIVGQSAPMIEVMKVVAQVAPTDSTILVTGESGTGKELIARAIHRLSHRRDRPFVAVNCAAIPESLQESEFFGHVKGAFTGAIQTKEGLFAEANRGTLFLDEIGETTLSTQVKLLRFLQSGEARKVGDSRNATLDVRLVAATNRDLRQAIASRGFREDLYYRLNIISIELPPLRQRTGDLPLLAEFFRARYARKLGVDVRGFSPEAMARLAAHSWPGNVRELENAIERAVALARGPVVTSADLPRWREVVRAGFTEPDAEVGEFPTLADVERRHIQRAMDRFDGNRSRASAALGISKTTLWRKLKELNLGD
ncbi:sigma-54 dependent transcriptional regulator [Myxococcota bacterium]|nr:sigma-54 dependent transcriptional regulator [Myxococcota bacterium]